MDSDVDCMGKHDSMQGTGSSLLAHLQVHNSLPDTYWTVAVLADYWRCLGSGL